MRLLAIALVLAYHAWKHLFSRAYGAVFYRGLERVPLPRFKTVAEAAAFLLERVKYRPDPWGGLVDHYTDPALVYAALLGRLAWERISCDCDDWANVFAALAPVPVQLVVVVDPLLVGTHVIALYRDEDGRAWALDTNQARELADHEESTLLACWRRIYPNYRYWWAIHIPAMKF